MCQTKYALAVPKDLGVRLNFQPCSEGCFFSGRPWSVFSTIYVFVKMSNNIDALLAIVLRLDGYFLAFL